MNGLSLYQVRKQFFVLVVAVVAVGCVTGCAGRASALGDQPNEASQVVLAATVEITDEDSCRAFDDVLTILQNVETSHNQQRLLPPEYEGWKRLATRVLGNISTRGEGEVSDAIATLKKLAPAVPIGSSAPTAIGTTEWYSSAELADACSAAGYALGAEAFTGG